MKIDCTITKNYLKETQRMCDYYCDCLEGCPATNVCKGTIRHDDSLFEIVQLWSDNHPRKTYLEDLMGNYPDFALCEDGTPDVCPSMLGFSNAQTCGNPGCEACWNQLIQ